MHCTLKPLSPAGYTVSFTAGQWARLQQAFPDGVCDSGARPQEGTPIGPPPESHPGPAK